MPSFNDQVLSFNDIVNFLRGLADRITTVVDNYLAGGGNGVPELNATVAPLAVMVIVGIIAIGIERRKRHQIEK